MTETMAIFLPVRDGGAYLSSAIDSIRAQTDQDWRLTVLDNRSSDDTVARVQAFDDPRITIETSTDALSITDSWKRILPRAADLPRGQLMTLIGHDDLFKPGFVATIRQLAAQDPAATLYQTQFELIDGTGALLRPARPVPVREEAGDLLAALCWGIRDSFGTGYAFRAGDYARVGGIPALPRLLYADHLLFSRLTALGHKRCAESTGCSYRLHRGSASNGISAARLGDHALALDLFVQTVVDEFAGFAGSDRGRLALAHLLTQEFLVLAAPGVGGVLSAHARAATTRLRDQLATVARQGSPIRIDTSLPSQARRWSVAVRLLRQRIGGRA